MYAHRLPATYMHALLGSGLYKNLHACNVSFYLHISKQHEETYQYDAHRLTQRKSHCAAARVRRANVQFVINPVYVHVILFQSW